MSDYGDLIGQSYGPQNPALPTTVGNIDEDPDKAQRAIDLSKATGVAPTNIYGDLEEFERQHKAVLASDIVANNPHLSDYVQSNPMAAKISNDDYGQLDATSAAVSKISLPMRILRAPEQLANALFPSDPLKHFREGGPLGNWLQTEDLINHPFASAAAATIGTPLELVLRGLGGTAETLAEAAEHGGEIVSGPSLGREAGAVAQTELMGMSGRHGIHLPEDPIARARPYLENGREPPPGILPEYDKYRADQNKDDVDALKDATSEAQASLTRDRSPEMFRSFIAQHTDAEIGIGGDAAVALYGDKVPAPDDGLLGWVPGIEDKLALARETGSDVSVPLADWLTHAEPETMQALHDDLRVRPGGITANEVKAASEAKEGLPEGAKEPGAEPIEEAVPSLRAATALEPLFSVGDRNLKIEKRPTEMKGDAFEADQWRILDEKGNKVGHLEITPHGSKDTGQSLYVDNVLGLGGLGPRDFGPALMRSLLRQIKEQYPHATEIGGFRISGAREAAGKEAETWVKLDRLDEESFRQMLEGGQWETYSSNIQAYIKPDFARSEDANKLVSIVSDELDRIVPQKVAIQGADTIKAKTGGIAGQRSDEDIKVGGTYIRYRDTYPIILYALDSENALGSARHEAIHHLREYGFFKPEEWSTLEAEALAGGWLSKYNIDRRYPTAKPYLKLEEAVAEAYQDWAGRQDNLKERAKAFVGIESPLDAIFRRMKQFFDGIRAKIGALVGKESQWEDIFQKVDTGEVGGREGTQPLDARAFNEKLSVEGPEDGSRVFERASALGMTVDQFKAYDKLIAARHAEDIEAAQKRVETQQRREQTKEWKDNRRELRQDISKEIHQRPDVAADLFLSTGELYGQKISTGYKLDSNQLSPEQKAAIPKDYQARGGLNPDDVANIFGYGSGDAMLVRIAEYNAAKKASGLGAKDFVARVTDIETDRQMRLRHGVLEDNIVDSVKEQVASETQLDILHEETVALGMKVGQAPLDKGTILKGVRDQFSKVQLGSFSSDRYMATAGKAGKAAELALLKGEPGEAFKEKQRQYYATALANEAIKVEKALGQFDKVAKRFSKREVSTVDQEYTNFIHDILMRVGKPVRRSIQDLETEIAAGEYKSLSDFVNGKETHGLREVPVADILLDPNFRKKFEDLTVDEFNATNDSVKTLIKNGRDEKKITSAGKAADFEDIRKQLADQLESTTLEPKNYDAKGQRTDNILPKALGQAVRSFAVRHIQLEGLFNRFDEGDPNGPFQQYLIRDLVDGASNEGVMRKRFAEKMKAVGEIVDPKKSVDNNLFKDPIGGDFMKLNRENLMTVLLNMGNESNMSKLVRGYGIKPEQLWAWVNQHATKGDWDWAQKVGDVFAEIKGEADTMYRNLSGVAPENLEIKPVQTLHGEYLGWYYPVIFHPEFEGKSKKLMGPNALEQEGYVRATTPSGYTKGRTGYAAPMALDLDMVPSRISQMLHDIAMRPSIINASKMFYDKDFRNSIAKYYNTEARDMLVPYLQSVANSANYVPKDQRMLVRAAEFARQNIISTLVGLNPGTVLKHGPTAAIQSLQEVGTIHFLKAIKSLFSVNEATGESNWQFAMKNFDELQLRHQNYDETLSGAKEEIAPGGQYMSLRRSIQKFSATPVAVSDLLSAVPMALAQYSKSMEEGATHGDAVYMANRAVRRAHGSMAITNRSGVMRSGALANWFTSVYGFFNHIMNRQYELMWKAGDALDMVKQGNYTEAMQATPELTMKMFAYVIAPALIEEMVTPLASSQNESWGKKAVKGLAFTLGASWVGVRDIVSAMVGGRDPSVGLVTTGYKTLTDFARDYGKDRPLSKEHAGRIIRDGGTLMGALTGMLPNQVGRAAQFGYGVHTGQERPKGPWGWMVGARFGTLKNHSGTFQEWQRHH